VGINKFFRRNKMADIELELDIGMERIGKMIKYY